MRGLKTLLAAAFFAAWAVPGRAAEGYSELKSGRYEIRVEGMVCTTCARLIVEEVLKLKEVQKATADFDQETLFLTVKLEHTLSVSKLEKALKKAAKRVDLQADYAVVNIRYRLDTKDIGEKSADDKKKKKKKKAE
jgi:cation transport ATPase